MPTPPRPHNHGPLPAPGRGQQNTQHEHGHAYGYDVHPNRGHVSGHAVDRRAHGLPVVGSVWACSFPVLVNATRLAQ